MKIKLNNVLTDTIEKCFEKGTLIRTAVPDYVIEVPNNPDHGHFATNLPLTLASSQKRPPRNIASDILNNIEDPENIIEKTEIAGPGFINFTIKDEQWYSLLSEIILENQNFGRNRTGEGERMLIEFVSANPTGPLHIGHGRGAALGDTLARIMSFCGYDVTREFYINDAGLQIRMLGESIFARVRQITDPSYPFPENGYNGEYVVELAKKIVEDNDIVNLSEEDSILSCARKGKDLMLEDIKKILGLFRVSFDGWYSESSLYTSNLLTDTLDIIKSKGGLYEKDGASWIRTFGWGDDKDRVVRKQDGQYTYFASDIAYHLDKLKRGYSSAINIWGADHHGYVPRMQAALSASGFPDKWLSVMLIQLVRLCEGGKEIKMSKRAGSFATLEDLINEVGVDAARFVFLTKNHDSPLDFDLELVKKQSNENPVFYVQYAHARICSIFRKAHEEGIIMPEKPDGFLKHLALEQEKTIIRLMAGFPSLLKDICRSLEPHRLTYYLTDLATAFHRYFNMGTKNPEHRIVTKNIQTSIDRLFLANGIKIVLANGLNLLGINAPEKM